MSGYWSDLIGHLHELELDHRRREENVDFNSSPSEGTNEETVDDMWEDTYNQVAYGPAPETSPSSPHTHTEIDLTREPEGEDGAETRVDDGQTGRRTQNPNRSGGDTDIG